MMRRRRDWSRLAWPPAVLALALVPPLFGGGFHLSVLDFIALYALIAIGLCLLVGYGGQLSISHSAFFAVGAYGSAILTVRLGWPPLAALAATQVLVAAVAWAIGAVVLRLHGHFLAIATLSFTIVVAVMIKELPGLTGGLQGISGVPPFAVAGFAFDTDLRFFYLAWSATMLALLFALNLVAGPLGHVFRAIKEGEPVVRLFGVDTHRCKVKLFVISSLCASLSGSLFAHFVGYVSPAVASLTFAIDIILVLALGGFTMLWGAVIGAAALTWLEESLTVFAEYKRLVFGVALVVIVLFFPRGLLPSFLDHLARGWRLARRARGS